MTKTLAELEQLATDCMESNSPGTVDRHKRAAQEARAAAACEYDNARGFYRDAEARELLMAVELERPELTTAERLLVAAMIAARADGEELELGAAAELLEAGDALAEAVELALETHIYEPGEVPSDSGELRAVNDWRAARGLEPLELETVERDEREEIEEELRAAFARSSSSSFDWWTAAVAGKPRHPLNAKAREFLNV
jgi:hypothetical protein